MLCGNPIGFVHTLEARVLLFFFMISAVCGADQWLKWKPRSDLTGRYVLIVTYWMTLCCSVFWWCWASSVCFICYQTRCHLRWPPWRISPLGMWKRYKRMKLEDQSFRQDFALSVGDSTQLWHWRAQFAETLAHLYTGSRRFSSFRVVNAKPTSPLKNITSVSRPLPTKEAGSGSVWRQLGSNIYDGDQRFMTKPQTNQ